MPDFSHAVGLRVELAELAAELADENGNSEHRAYWDGVARGYAACLELANEQTISPWSARLEAARRDLS